MTYNEIYWTLIPYMIPIIEIFIKGYCLYRLVRPFIENKRSAAGVGTVYSLTMIILYIIPLNFDYFIAYILGTFAAFIVMCRIEQKNYGQKVFISVTFFSLCWFTFAIAEILYDNLYSFIEHTGYLKEHPDMWFAVYVMVCIFYLVAGFLLTAIGIWCILKAYTHKSAEMTHKELLVIVIPSFMGVVGYLIVQYYRNFYIEKSGKLPSIYDVMALLYYIVAVISIVVVIVLYHGIKTGQEEKMQNELLAMQIDSIRQHIEQVENLYNDIHSIKHDMTNHIITLERLYAGNKTEEAVAYSTELKAVLTKVTGKINSGNPVTDVILQKIQGEACKRKIRFDLDFHYPADSNVNAFDISVILNNALQNALENSGEGENSFIAILSYRRNNAYMIEIRNSFTGNLQWDKESGLPVTSKEKRADLNHGYGLANIRRVAGKYSGDIAIDLQNDMFCLSILLMME